MAHDVGEAVFGNVLVPAAATSLTTLLVTSLAYQRVRRGLNRAINISETFYMPSGIINPATGEEFIDQEVNTYDNDFNFREAFRGDEGAELVKIVEKALAKTNEHTVLAFSFLEDLIDKEDYKDVHEQICTKWKGYFSSLLGDKQPYSFYVGERERPEEKTILALPVFEKTDHGGSRKVLLLPPSYLQKDGLPKAENLRVKVGRDEFGVPIYEHRPEHEANARLRTLQRIRYEIGADRAEWLYNYAPDIKTGRSARIAEPVLRA